MNGAPLSYRIYAFEYEPSRGHVANFRGLDDPSRHSFGVILHQSLDRQFLGNERRLVPCAFGFCGITGLKGPAHTRRVFIPFARVFSTFPRFEAVANQPELVGKLQFAHNTDPLAEGLARSYLFEQNHREIPCRWAPRRSLRDRYRARLKSVRPPASSPTALIGSRRPAFRASR